MLYITGGGWYLLGVQALMCVCMMTWSIVISFILLWFINKIVTIRMEVHCELLGADLTEHHVKHGQVKCSPYIYVSHTLIYQMYYLNLLTYILGWCI